MHMLAAQRISNNDRLAQRIRRRLSESGHAILPFEVRLGNTESYCFGDGEPQFSISFKNSSGLQAIGQLDQLSFSEAYINGNLDIDGDMWAVVSNRGILRDNHPLHLLWRRLLPLLSGQLRTNQHAIADHYEIDNEFFLTFLDETRCYSQAIFERDNEPLEQAQQRKLDFAMRACHLKPGDRVLDVGGGWGSFVEHAGKQGVHVTALTLAHQSEQYLKALIQSTQLPCSVEFGDFYKHKTTRPYDAIVILGVMEHLPDYRAVLQQFQRLLKPGGRVYLDASSFRQSYSKPTFISRYVFPGNHRYFCLHDFLARVAKSNLEVQSIYNDRHSYYLTCRQWAKNLEAAREQINKRWGEKLYRIFRLYLWGSSYAFYSRSMDAFRVVLELARR